MGNPTANVGATVRAWRLILKAAIFLAISVLAAESIWRALGYVPAGSDMRNFARLHDAAMNDPNAVALVGSSRIRCGMSPATLHRLVPDRHFFQLGILGNSGMPVLQDLADDPAFRGSVICEFHPSHWLMGYYPFTVPPEPLAYTHPQVSGAYVEMLLGEHLREWFSFYSYNMVTELPRIVQHKPPPGPEHPDRFLPYRYISAAADNAQLQLWLQGTRQAGEQAATSAPGNVPSLVPVWVKKIRDRGGDVLFVRMPVDGELRVLEEKVFPQTPALVARLRAQGMQVVEYTELGARFYCPDGSHLSAADAIRFTTMLAETPAARRLLSR